MADPSLPLSDRESKILSSFLLSRSSLQDVISLRSFAALFPKQHRNNNPSQIRDLYRDLQLQRERQIDRVRKNIQLEVQLGIKVREERSAVAQTERDKFTNDVDDEAGDVDMMGVETYGSGGRESKKTISVEKANEVLEYANEVLKDEWEKLDEECKAMQEELQGIVGDLSDLRYGKFDNDELVGEVLKSLEDLQRACEAVPQGDAGGSAGS